MLVTLIASNQLLSQLGCPIIDHVLPCLGLFAHDLIVEVLRYIPKKLISQSFIREHIFEIADIASIIARLAVLHLDLALPQRSRD